MFFMNFSLRRKEEKKKKKKKYSMATIPMGGGRKTREGALRVTGRPERGKRKRGWHAAAISFERKAPKREGNRFVSCWFALSV